MRLRHRAGDSVHCAALQTHCRHWYLHVLWVQGWTLTAWPSRGAALQSCPGQDSPCSCRLVSKFLFNQSSWPSLPGPVPKTHFAFFSVMLSLIRATLLNHPPECLFLLHSYPDERVAGIPGEWEPLPTWAMEGEACVCWKRSSRGSCRVQERMTSPFRVCVEVQLCVKPLGAGGTCQWWHR